MAVKTYRVGFSADGNYGALFEQDQTAATRADGWTVAKLAAGNMSEFDVGVKQVSGSFAVSAKPASFLTGSTANAFKIPTALTGTFAATDWTFTFAVRASLAASAQAGRIRMRVFKSVNADGSSATELTGSTLVGTTSAALSTTVDATSVVTWSPGTTIVLNGEYLFFVIAWEITTASGSNSGDVLLRTGQSAGGSRLVTPDATITTTVTSPVLDNFNRTAPIGANYSPIATSLPSISSNQAYSGGNISAGCIYNVQQLGPDCEVYITVPTIAATGSFYLYARMTGSANSYNGYVAQIAMSGTVKLQRMTGGGFTNLSPNPGQVTQVPVAGDQFVLQVVGNVVTVAYRPGGTGPWTVLVQGTDTNVTGPGYIGFSIENDSAATIRLDDLGATPLFANASITDNFNRSNGALALPWFSQNRTGGDGLQVISNQMKQTIAGSYDGVRFDVPDVANMDVAVTLVAMGADASHMQLHARRSRSADTSYFVDLLVSAAGNDTLTIFRRIASSDTPLGLQDSTQNFAAGDSIGLRVVGSNINVYRKPSGGNWTLVFSRNDTTPITAAGVPGIFCNDSSFIFDDWISPTPVTPPTPISGTDANGTTTESASVTAYSAYASAVRTDGPIAHYLLEETSGTSAKDEIAPAGNGVITGSPLLGRPGLIASGGNAIDTGDAGQTRFGSVDITNYTKLNQADNGPITLEAWIKPSGNAAGSGIVSRDYAGGVVDWELGVSADGVSTDPNRLMFGFYTGGVWYVARDTVDLVTGTTYHVVGTWDGTLLTLYKNGVQVAQITPGVARSNLDTITSHIGLRHDGGGGRPWFPGVIDEVAIYQKALTPAQVSSHYAIGSGLTQVSGTDTNSTTTESASVVAAVSSLDPTGPETETVSLAAKPTATDTNGTVTENATPVVPITATDTNGVVTEATASTATVSSLDPTGPEVENASANSILAVTDANGTVTESASTVTQVLKSDTDAGTDVETTTLTATTSASDLNGAVTESASITFAISSVDANSTTTETVSAVASSSAADSLGATTEVVSLVAKPTVTDINGTITESTSLVTLTPVSASDANGTVTETVSIQLTTSDVATDTENATLVATQLVTTDSNSTTTEFGTTATIQQVSGTDANGVTTETVAVVVSALVSSDVGTISETTTIKVVLTAADLNGVTTEAFTTTAGGLIGSDANSTTTEGGTLSAKSAGTDANVGILESASTNVPVPASDNNSVTSESLVLSALTNTSDVGTGADVATNGAPVLVTDANGIVTETVTSIKILVDANASDTGTITETVTLVARPITTDTNGTTTETTTLAQSFSSTDTNGVTTETAAVTKIQLSATDSNGSTAETTLAIGAQITVTDGNLAFSEVAGIGTIKVGTDFNTATTEFASIILRVSPALSDFGTGTDSATVTSTRTNLDVGVGLDTSTLKAVIVTFDVNGVTTEIADNQVRGILPAPSGTIVKNTRGDIMKPNSGRILHRTRGQIAKPTSGRTVK